MHLLRTSFHIRKKNSGTYGYNYFAALSVNFATLYFMCFVSLVLQSTVKRETIILIKSLDCTANGEMHREIYGQSADTNIVFVS